MSSEPSGSLKSTGNRTMNSQGVLANSLRSVEKRGGDPSVTYSLDVVPVQCRNANPPSSLSAAFAVPKVKYLRNPLHTKDLVSAILLELGDPSSI